MEEQSRNIKTVFTIVERGGKSFWTRVGVGFTNRDGSLNLRLDAIPLNGTLQVRDWEPYERRTESGDASGRARGRARDAASGVPGEGPHSDSLV